MKAIQVRQIGGAEKLEMMDVPVPKPGPGQALVKMAVAGVNFIDIYFRIGLYKAETPIALGVEGAGTVEAVGPDVRDLAVGERVAFATMSRGAYAEYCLQPAWQLVRIPDALDFQSAAAAMLQGMTAHYLSHSTFPLKPGDSCVVHAAAGGVGGLLVQMAKRRGARVFATAGNEQKAQLAREYGADEVILYTEQDFQPIVRERTGGRGVDVVYDSVGVSTYLKSMDSLRRRGLLCLYGQSSGAVPPFDPTILNAKGSLFLTRPKLGDYTATREELLERAGDVLGWVASGDLKLRIDRAYPLAEAQQAHRDLEGRKTAGKLLLLPV